MLRVVRSNDGSYVKLPVIIYAVLSVVLFEGCSSMFGPGRRGVMQVIVPANTTVIHLASGDTVAHSKAEAYEATHHIINGRPHAYKFDQGDSSKYSYVPTEGMWYSILNIYNLGFGTILDRLVEADARPVWSRAGIGSSSLMATDTIVQHVDDSLRELTSYEHVCSVLDGRTNNLVSANAGISVGDFFVNVSWNPQSWLSIGYSDWAAVSGSSDVHQAYAHTAALRLIHPPTRLSVAGFAGYGASLWTLRRTNSLSGPVAGWGVGYVGQWGTIEYRQLLPVRWYSGASSEMIGGFMFGWSVGIVL